MANLKLIKTVTETEGVDPDDPIAQKAQLENPDFNGWSSILGLLQRDVDGRLAHGKGRKDAEDPPESVQADRAYTEDMSTPSREEFDAKLREIATQAENRALRTDNKIDELLHRLEKSDAVQEERLKSVFDKLQTVSNQMSETRTSVGSLKSTIVTTVIATGLGVSALVYTLNTNLFSAFESGKNTATALADASSKLSAATDRLDKISRLEISPAVPAPQPSASSPASPKK